MGSHPAEVFDWHKWYKKVGGRPVQSAECEELMLKLDSFQGCSLLPGVADRKSGFSDAGEATRWVTDLAAGFGADATGIAVVEPGDIYVNREVRERFAIVIAKKMRWSAFRDVPSDESALECLYSYSVLEGILLGIAEALRKIGYSANVEHAIGDMNVLHIPLAVKAGMGELGRHGSLIHPRLGPMIRLGSVTTDLPLTAGKKIDAGIATFCDNCTACRRMCPGEAIPDQRSFNQGGNIYEHSRYIVDTTKCFPMFAGRKYCSVCLAVCNFNRREWAHD